MSVFRSGLTLQRLSTAFVRQPHAAPMVWLVLCGATLMAAIAFGTAITIERFRDNAIETAKQELESDVLVLSRHFDQRFEDFTVLQRQVSATLQSAGIASAESFSSEMGTLAVHEDLRLRAGGWTDVAGINVFDARGDLINSSQRWPVPDVNIADRDYFRQLKQDPSQLTTFGIVSGRFSGETAIVFSRRISGPHGEFLGVVNRAIAPSMIEGFFKSTSLGPGSSVTMHHRDGTVMARYPHVDALVGRNLNNGSAEQRAVFERPEFTTRLTSPVDGKDRLVTSRMLVDYPLIIVGTKTVEAALATWRIQMRFFISVAAASILVIALTLGLIFRQIARQLSLDKQRLNTAINNMSQGLLLFDSAQRLVVCNGKYLEMYGLSPQVVRPGCSVRDLLRHRQQNGAFRGDVDDYCDKLLTKLGSASSKLVEVPDGRLIQVTNTPVPNGGWVATHEDVTERIQTEERIAHLAHYDSLTDLPNRVLFRDYVERKFADLIPGAKFAILYIDVDEFKGVNDSLGHHVGDELLKLIAHKLRGCVGPNDLVARLGGDEFAIVITGVSTSAEVRDFADRIQTAIRARVSCLGQELSTDASIGIAIAPDDGSSLEELLKNADLAMYAAKASGRRTYRFFAPEMDIALKARRGLEQELRAAVTQGGFQVYYQPLVDLSRNVIVGCEALLRWHHPVRGMISPAEFIPLAEETGLINELGEWALRRACTDAACWRSDIKIAVNVSPVQFKSKTLGMKVASALADSGLSPGRLELEITEAVLISNDDEALTVLNQLRALGVGIALDDFGTGYSSLSYLRRFPFDKIKIDRSFISDLADARGSSPIVRAVVNMASAHSMTTTAEGVETEGQREILRELGCNEMQGYLFSPAVPVEKFVQLLSSGETQAA